MNTDWDDLHLAKITAEEGSAAAAARRLGIDQTTASRRLARLERRLGIALFDRIDRRLVPRPALAAVAADLEAMADLARRGVGRLGDERQRLEGHVTVSTVDLLATRMLAPALAAFRAAHPGVRLTLDLSDTNVSIGAREADIAVRLARPQADTALTRRLGALDFALYGPAGGVETSDLPLAAHGERLAHLPESRWLAERFPRATIAFRADTAGPLLEAVAAGHLAMLPCFLGDRDARIVRLGGAEATLCREVWLMVHPDRRGDRAVAATVDWVTETLTRALAGR